LTELSGRGIGPEEGRLYQTALEADAAVFDRSVQASLALERERARAAVREAVAARRAARRDAETALGVVAAVGPPASSAAALVLYAAGFVAIQATELVLSWTTLPMLIGVRRYSVEGVLVSALPVAALLAIEVVFARAVAAHTRLHAGPGAGRQRLAAIAALGGGAALVALLLLNVGLMDQIATLRELTALAARTDALAVDAAALAMGIRVISIAAAIDGAVLLVLLEVERRKRRAATRARRAMRRAVAAHIDAQRLAGECRYVARIAADADRIATDARNAFLDEATLRVHQAVQRGRPAAASLEDRVAALLGLTSARP
jgi:hypothetical protein